jgi:hypothetical protein
MIKLLHSLSSACTAVVRSVTAPEGACKQEKHINSCCMCDFGSLPSFVHAHSLSLDVDLEYDACMRRSVTHGIFLCSRALAAAAVELVIHQLQMYCRNCLPGPILSALAALSNDGSMFLTECKTSVHSKHLTLVVHAALC